MKDTHGEPQRSSPLSRRQAMQLGAMTVGGVILGTANASAAGAPPAGPGQDGAGAGNLRRPATATHQKPVAPTSYNGWPVGRFESSIGIESYYVTGTSIVIPVDGGDVAWALMYLAARFNAEVEKLHDGQVWGYDYRVDVNNRKWWSCHASGTAVDFNAVLHPNGASGTFTARQVKGIRRILADCGDVIFWGGDFSGIPDEMHFEINVPPGDPQLPALVAQIRGIAPPPPTARVITLSTANNAMYVSATHQGSAALIANRTVAGPCERFDIVPVNGTQIALRSHANNLFVCADQAGNAPLIANRKSVGRWETFTLVPQLGGNVALRAAVNGRYVTAGDNGTQPLIANRTSVGSWGNFDLETG